MALPPLVRDGVSVVLKGPFNPALFSPAWMLSQDLIGLAEYSDAKIQLITSDIAQFRMGWLSFQATSEGIQFDTGDESEFERARDVAVGVLRILEYAPVSALGINRNVHFRVANSTQWHKIGDALAPKDLWEEALRLPGMQRVAISGVRDGNHHGRVQVSVEASAIVRPNGVYVGFNDHYDLFELDEPIVSRDQVIQVTPELFEPTVEKRAIAINVLTDRWNESMKEARHLIARVARIGEESR